MAKAAALVEQLFTSKSTCFIWIFHVDQHFHWQSEIEDLSKNPIGDPIKEHEQIDKLLCGLIEAEKGLFVLMCFHNN